MKNLFRTSLIMKPINLFKLIVGFLLLLFLVLSCTNDELVTTDQSENALDNKKELSNKVIMDKLDNPIELEGFVSFPSYAIKEHRVIAPGEIYKFPTTATLTKVDAQNYILTGIAVGFTGNIYVEFDVKMTPSGEVSFTWPETYMIDQTTFHDITSIISYHDGTIIHGPGINKSTVNFKGKFDGTTFQAESHFMGKQVAFGSTYFYSEVYLGQLIEGPIAMGFSIFDLKVVEG